MILTRLLIVYTLNLPPQFNKYCEILPTLIYEDVRCVLRLGSDGCPSSYDCSDLKPRKDSCLFKGVYYKSGEFINGTAGCNIGCFCSAESGRKSSIVCGTEDCFYGPDEQPQCYNIYKRDDCCSSRKQCPPFDNLATCKNNGKTYREGERFFPTDSCDSCICEKGYKDDHREPFCTRRKCDVQIRNSEQIEANCAPAYRKNEIKCCPTMFICPEKSVVENLESAERDSEFKCNFGTREFNVMDKFTLKYDGNRSAFCSCTIPPLLTCELSF